MMESTSQDAEQSPPNATPTPVQPTELIEKPSKTLLYLVIGILVLLILGVGGYVVYDQYYSEREDSTILESTDEENLENAELWFLVRPSFQAEPRVYTSNGVTKLPNSQRNTLSPDEDQMAVCGEGGVYLFTFSDESVQYLYERDWFPCDVIEFIDEGTLFVEEYAFGDRYFDESGDLIAEIDVTKTILDMNGNVVSEEEYESEINLDEGRDTPTTGYGDEYLQVCDKEELLCAEISDESHILLMNYVDDENTLIDVNDVDAVMGINYPYVFYAMDVTMGSRRSNTIMNQVQAMVLNHELWVYNIETEKSRRLLDEFRFDYESIVFRD